MKWNNDAKGALSRVPFFLKKRVKKRVEEAAASHGENTVTLEHVRTCQNDFLSRMEDEVRGYQVETCFGPSGCPNRAVCSDGLGRELEHMFILRDLKGFLKKKVHGPLKMHHEFRVSISDCPNACSRPQIVDVGFIGASKPRVGKAPCSECEACVEACKESALSLEGGAPAISEDRCLNCGACIRACPTGTLEEARKGYRVLLGGKLGRHPRLGEEIPGIHRVEDIPSVVEQCLGHYLDHCRAGERFGEILGRTGMQELENRAGV